MKEKSFAEKFVSLNKEKYEPEDLFAIFQLADITSGISYGDFLNDGLREFDFDYCHLFPEGIEVKLNYEKIRQRGFVGMSAEFEKFIEDNKDKVFHLHWEVRNSYVSLKEDERYTTLDGKIVKVPTFLFDPLSDILVFYNEEWKPSYEVRKILIEKSSEK